jgi:hypothetical protein
MTMIAKIFHKAASPGAPQRMARKRKNDLKTMRGTGAPPFG